MSALLREVSLLLSQFQESDWKDLHVRTARYSLFLAKSGGAPNPMLTVGPVATVKSSPATTVTAPHLATVRALLAVGSDVQKGATVGQIEVLGTPVEVVSSVSGTVAEIFAPGGTRVEYGSPLLRIV